MKVRLNKRGVTNKEISKHRHMFQTFLELKYIHQQKGAERNWRALKSSICRSWRVMLDASQRTHNFLSNNIVWPKTNLTSKQRFLLHIISSSLTLEESILQFHRCRKMLFLQWRVLKLRIKRVTLTKVKFKVLLSLLKTPRVLDPGTIEDTWINPSKCLILHSA